MMETDSTPATQVIPLNTIRVETALSRYPVHRLARRGSIRIEIKEPDGRGESSLKWKVSYNSEYGQPGPLAYKLDTLIINRRIEEAQRPLHRILKLGSLSDICRELNLADSGKNRNDIRTALYQNAFAGITAKTQYRQTDGTETSLETGFTRYSIILTGEKLPDGRKADGVYIVLNDVFLRVINGAMTRPLDYDYLKSLSPAAQRFYELLSYQMYAALKYDRPRAKLVYSELCAHAPQTRHTDWDHVRSQMNKIHRSHREAGYIIKVDFQQTTDADGRPDWILHYQPGPKARAEFRVFSKRGGPPMLEVEPLDSEPSNLAPKANPLELELIRRGVTATTAAELVHENSEEKIQAQIERLDWLLEKKPGKIEEPAAYLVQSIKNDYAAPKGYVSNAERERRAEAKRQAEQQAAEERRREREQHTAEAAERQAADAYWKSLTAEEQATLQAQADAEADPQTLALENGPLKQMGQRIRRDAYIRQLLRNHASASTEA
jgi:hypothetical protein